MKLDPFPKIKKFFSSINKQNKKNKSFHRNIYNNQKLIFNLRKNKRPKIQQIKYLPKILSQTEKSIVRGLTAVILVCLVFMGGVFVLDHIVTVPSRSGEYIEGMSGYPQLINPLYCQLNDVDNDLAKLIFSGLLKYDKDLKLAPDLAASYEISEDQKQYTFKLRKDVLWHSGDKFTADDIIFTIEAIRDYSEYNKSPLYDSFKSIEVVKIDDFTVLFKLSEPYAPFLNLLTFGIIPQNIWLDISAQNAALNQYNIKPIGTGMYEFSALSKDASGNIKSYTLLRNEDYYGAKPYLKKLIFKFYPDFSSLSFALKAKEIQGVSFLPKEFRSDFNDNKNIEIKPLNLPQYTAVFFNQENNEVLKDKKVRLALALGLNKEAILNKELSSEGIVMHGPILPGFVGYNPDLEKYSYNPDESNKILDELGWKKVEAEELINREKEKIEKSIKDQEEKLKKLEEEKEDEENDVSLIEETKQNLDSLKEQIEQLKDYELQAFYREKEGKLLSMALTTVDSENYIKTAKSIKEFWGAIGVNTMVKLVESRNRDKEILKNRDYECLLYGEVIGSDPDPYPFWHSSQNKYPGLNLAIFNNKEVDKLLEEARQTSDSKKRNDKYVHFQNILVKELPAIFLYSPTYSYILGSNIKNFNVQKIYLPRDRFSNIEDWYTKTERIWQWEKGE